MKWNDFEKSVLDVQSFKFFIGLDSTLATFSEVQAVKQVTWIFLFTRKPN